MAIRIAQWRPEYETGEILIDEQHQTLFSTINSLNDALLMGQGPKVIHQTLTHLHEYTCIHFDSEEEFMRAHGYPHADEHHRKHEALKGTVNRFCDEVQTTDNLPALTIKVSHFLNQWLIQHIKQEDFRMIDFCRGHQEISPPDHPIKEAGRIAHWRSEYETGYGLIDGQHRGMFHTINALNQALLEGRGASLLLRTLNSLRRYTTVHFETEEAFMRRYHYPHYEAHHEKHLALTKRVEEFYHRFETELHGEPNAQLTIMVSHFLTDWLIRHIRQEDLEMVKFLRPQYLREHPPLGDTPENFDASPL